MGFILNDVLILSKNASILSKRDAIYTLGNPTSYVYSNDLKIVLNKNYLKKFKIDRDFFSKEYLEKLNKQKKNQLVSFDFFSKLLNFKNFYSIDIDPNENPTFCMDVTKKNLDGKFILKADMIYDTGSIGYTLDPVSSLNFLTKLVNNEGIIIHQSSHNGFINTGYFQFNLNFFQDYYNRKDFEILNNYYGFISSWLNKLFHGKWKIDINKKTDLRRIRKVLNLFYCKKKR